MKPYKTGDKAYIVESNRTLREVIVVNCSGGLYTVKFADADGGMRVKGHRLYESEKEAGEYIEQIKIQTSKLKPGRNRYNSEL